MDMISILQKQKEATLKAPVVPASLRQDRLDRLLHMLHDNADNLCDALMEDYGYRSRDQSYFAEIVTSHKPIKIARRNVHKWMKVERRRAGLPFNLAGGRAEIHYQPLGTVGIISPWNFPVNLTVTPLAGVLAAGNRAMIKPSELTPETSRVIADMVSKTFDAEEVAVITGGAEVGRDFSALPFDHLLYTGGEAVAKHIMREASDNLVPLTLELGGKSPVVIGEKADLSLASKRIFFGKTFNAGQICLAPDYVFVPAARLEEFVREMEAAATESLPAERGVQDYVSVINDRHAARIRAYLADAESMGSSVIELGPAEATTENMVPVSLVIDPDESCAISKEEIFGPLLVVRTYETLDQAIDYINRRPKPLALYYFGKCKEQQRRILMETSSGGVTINDVIMHYIIDDLPFGGVGSSGMGAYHGLDGFRRFSHARAVYRQSPFDVGGMLRPPFGPMFRKITNLMMKFS